MENFVFGLIHQQDIQLGYGTDSVQLPDGSSANLNRVGINTFISWFNVKDFGAAGDGVSDDTTAIQSAINASFATNGAVYFPAGIYKTTSTLTITGAVSPTLIGDAPAGTAQAVIVAHHTNTILQVGDGVTRVFAWCIRHLGLQYFTGLVGGIALDVNNTSISLLEHIGIGAGPNSTFATGIRFTDSEIINIYRPIISNSGASSFTNTTGILFNNNGTPNLGNVNINIYGGDISYCAIGLDVRIAVNVSVQGVAFEALDKAFNFNASTANSAGITAHNVNVSHCGFLMLPTSSTPNQLPVYVSGDPVKPLIVTGFAFKGNRVFLPTPGVNVPIIATLSGSAAGSFFNISVEDNSMFGVQTAAMSGDGTNIRGIFGWNYIYNAAGSSRQPDITGTVLYSTTLPMDSNGNFLNYRLPDGANLLAGSSSNTMTRPTVGTTRITGEIAGVSLGTPGNDDGFLRLSAGGGASASQKAWIDLSGYSGVADMAQSIVMGFGTTELFRLQPSLVSAGYAVSLGPKLALLCIDSGFPNGVVAAPPGSLYLNVSGGSGTTLWVKESGSGNTGWNVVTTGNTSNLTTSAFAGLSPSASNGTISFCTDCKGPADSGYTSGAVAVPGGSGALVVRVAGTWRIS